MMGVNPGTSVLRMVSVWVRKSTFLLHCKTEVLCMGRFCPPTGAFSIVLFNAGLVLHGST